MAQPKPLAPAVIGASRSAVLRVLLLHGPLSRRAIAGRIGITPSGVSYIVAELIDAGLVAELPPRDEPLIRAGRPEIPIELRPDGGHVLAIRYGLRTTQVAVGSLRGTVLEQVEFPTPEGVDEAVHLAVASAARLRRRRAPAGPLLGAGVSCVGDVDVVAGNVRFVPQLGWHDVPLRAALESRLDVPVAIENNRRAMAFGEMLLGLGRGVRDFLLIQVGTTLGAAIVAGGRVQPGAHGVAGAIGHVVVAPDGPRCACGQVGCLEAVAGQVALHRELREATRHSPDHPLADVVDATTEQAMLALYRAALVGDPLALGVVEPAWAPLAALVSSLMAATDPELVIVASLIPGGGELLERLIGAHVARTAPRAGYPVPVRASSIGADIGIVGAIAVALEHFVFQPGAAAPLTPLVPFKPPRQASAATGRAADRRGLHRTGGSIR